MIYYKVLGEKGAAFHGGCGAWHLPVGRRPGKWMHVEGEIVACLRGLHLCRRIDLIHWLGPVIYEAEAKGPVVAAAKKVVVANARLLRRLDTWNERTARLFAADCASYALRQLTRTGIEVDPRITECIRVVRLYARGEETEDERLAARSAAWSAAWWPAWSAARSAAESAAWSAAWSAARSAAESAAWSAADSAARSAAWSAAESAAWSAAESAASSDARSAAWSAGRSAAWSWQTRRLFEYLDGMRS